jgi:hypothetical protein
MKNMDSQKRNYRYNRESRVNSIIQESKKKQKYEKLFKENKQTEDAAKKILSVITK